MIYATQVLKEKEEFRATVAPVWVVLNFFSDGYPVQERPGWNGRYSTDLYQYPAITYSYMVR